MPKLFPAIACSLLILSACGGGGGTGAPPSPPPPPPPPANDADSDGVNDPDDNCPNNANADQADDDYDGQGNVCDAVYGEDADGDGVLDVTVQIVAGSLASDPRIVINGSGFTEKTSAMPYFWWTADGGDLPSSLGRKSDWDRNSFGIGSFSTDQVAPGSTRSVMNDHGGNSGASLSHVYFDSPRLYMYRKTYEDFDITKDFGLRSRVTLASGTLNAGDLVTGQTSGATATIARAIENIGPGRTHVIFFNSAGSTLANNPPLDFIDGEQMTSNAGAVMANSDSAGVFRSFNFKTLRFWALDVGQTNNMHLHAQGISNNPRYGITPEGTGGTTFAAEFTIQQLSQLPEVWKTEEFEYETSGIDATDGTFLFYQNGVLGTDNKFRNRDAADPERYNAIVMSQVSQGAQLGSVMYYDSLYIEDSWHRVIICAGATFDACGSGREIQIPTEWQDNQIRVELHLGGLDTSAPVYLYIVGIDGQVNMDGYQISP